MVREAISILMLTRLFCRAVPAGSSSITATVKEAASVCLRPMARRRRQPRSFKFTQRETRKSATQRPGSSVCQIGSSDSEWIEWLGVPLTNHHDNIYTAGTGSGGLSSFLARIMIYV